MRKRIIAGNWKMFKLSNEAADFAEQIKEQLKPSDHVEAVICPPALYLNDLLQRFETTAIKVGAQTMHDTVEGAFTGEISPAMLENVGVDYVILGHSERRQYFNETDESVNKKVLAAFDHHLVPIVCVGETLEERDAHETVSIVSAQVEKAFSGVTADQAKQAVIAYEPIWAIGTGKTATADDANEVCAAIRHKVETLYAKDVSEAIRIQYGGSVKPENIAELLSKDNIDGALVGGASLDPAAFVKLVEAGTHVE
ncbi:triose-phosphate isomerase [Sporosarcina sp. P26b]|uniref:triose-phosphate isomerase n=1 Tax=unclassified Sporosarcina TaxID=2647733 RepID=UPI000C16674C|nr:MULTISPECIES: triose-phosphate isomerase [unclassified Sporosarcina]PIC73314.1 triose-phosphate isomerase [Sporosarcina sp. P17b]PIC94977.1 triose-phosphate isomerase [Sporosarcina sp. P26b]